MYVITNTSFRGTKEFFTGKTEKVQGKCVANMSIYGTVKVYKTLKGVMNATRKLEKRCPEQKPFYAATYQEYLCTKWQLNQNKVKAGTSTWQKRGRR